MTEQAKKPRPQKGRVRVSFEYDIDLTDDDQAENYGVVADIYEAMAIDEQQLKNDDMDLNTILDASDSDVKFEVISTE